MDRGRIKRLLLDYFGIDPAEEARQAFQIGDHVKNTVLATTARPSMGQRTVYAIYEHSCFACESGKVLTNLEEMAERFPNTRFNFVLTRSYRKKDIETFIEDYKVSIPVLIADHSFREFWDETRDPDTYPHLLNGLLLALEKDGTIGLIKNTEEIELLESWLLSSKNQEI
ncbi:MAG: hypothetical protein QNK37_34800 [Acidobacteriota bacterium]|nr:hypothetical protein [Acidobacteriota bacterium]